MNGEPKEKAEGGMRTAGQSVGDGSETLLKFPTEFPIKAMGRREEGFAQTVLEIIMKHAPDFNAESLAMRPSKNGNFLSVTATINATSKAQLDDIYYALTAHPAVLMAF
jgi:putative lipoic acid-binding regulatory protein